MCERVWQNCQWYRVSNNRYPLVEVVEAMNIICPKDLYVSATLFFLLCCYLLVGKVSSRIATYIVSNQCRWVTNKLHKFQSSPPHSYDIDVWAIKCSVQRLIVNCFIWKPYDRCKERQHFVAISKNGLRLDVAYTCRSFAQLHSNTNENWFVVRRFVDFLDSIFWFESFFIIERKCIKCCCWRIEMP